MKSIGIFEAKTRLSEICEEVAKTRAPIMITRRGKPIVRMEPIAEERLTIKERRSAYMATHSIDESEDAVDFEPAARSRDISAYHLKE